MCWREAANLADVSPLPADKSRVALVGCGTSFHVAGAVAMWRESGGRGETDAFAASEMLLGRRYDTIVVISRSGTTTE